MRAAGYVDVCGVVCPLWCELWCVQCGVAWCGAVCGVIQGCTVMQDFLKSVLHHCPASVACKDAIPSVLQNTHCARGSCKRVFQKCFTRVFDEVFAFRFVAPSCQEIVCVCGASILNLCVEPSVINLKLAQNLYLQRPQAFQVVPLESNSLLHTFQNQFSREGRPRSFNSDSGIF